MMQNGLKAIRKMSIYGSRMRVNELVNIYEKFVAFLKHGVMLVIGKKVMVHPQFL